MHYFFKTQNQKGDYVLGDKLLGLLMRPKSPLQYEG